MNTSFCFNYTRAEIFLNFNNLRHCNCEHPIISKIINIINYFIIYRNDNNERIGTVRLYDFKTTPKSFCWGSWILNQNKTRYAAIESALLIYKFAFDQLKFDQSHFDVRKENLGVHNFHIRLGTQHISSNNLDNFYVYPASSYYSILSDYKKFIE